MTRPPLRQSVLVLVVALAACTDPPTTTGPTEPSLATGGIPGPPPWVILPDRRRGPPPDVPGRVPPDAGPPAFLTDIRAIGAGSRYSCALRSDGAVFCWGNNSSGQLGDGTQAPSSVPVEVVGGRRFARLFVGDGSACALTADGTAWCWGSNFDSELGVAGIDLSREPVAVSGDHRFTHLSIGLTNTCGVAMDGVTYCWGSNQRGLLGNGTIGGESAMPVPVANSATLGFVEVSVAFFHVCARDAAGATYCWGSSSEFGNGAIGPIVTVPTPAAGGAHFTRLAAGNFYTCALDDAGAGSCWGTANPSGEMGRGVIGGQALTPAPIVGGVAFASLSAQNHNSIIATTCGVSESSDAWCWGSNQEGQLGAPTTETCTLVGLTYGCSSSPRMVTGGISFETVAVGLDHVCGVSVTGIAYCWGDNSFGELGDGSMVDQSSPVPVNGLEVELRSESIVVTPFATTLDLLEATQQFTAVAVDLEGSLLSPQPSFIWSSSNPAVARVDQNGLATALTDGSTVITAAAPDGLTGRASLRVAIVDPVRVFTQAWVGDGGANSDGVIVLGGLLADEWSHSGTFLTRRAIDQRVIAPDNATIAQAYNRLVLARRALEFEAARLQGASPGDQRIGRMLTLAGFTYLAFAENFCSGVPLDDPNVGPSTGDLFALAATRFDQALAGPIDAGHANGARVGSARAQLGLGNLAAAATAAAAVPSSFVLNTTHTLAAGEGNGVFLLNIQNERVTLSHNEGISGFPFRGTDPRVPWTRTDGGTDRGFNGLTPQFDMLKYPSATSPVQLASGVEARLIEAEAMLRTGDAAGSLASLNELRAPVGLPPLVDPGGLTARIDLLFMERAFWLFATGHRLGDVRRLIAQVGRLQMNVLPMGPFAFGGAYGSDANLPVPEAARGAGFMGCVIRDR